MFSCKIKKTSQWLSLVLAVNLLCSVAWSLETRSFSKKDRPQQAPRLFDIPKPKGLSPLAQIKWFQVHRSYASCVEKARSQLSDKSLGVWLGHVYLVCLENLYSRAGSWKAGRILTAYKKIEPLKKELLGSPHPAHRQIFIRVFLDMLDLSMNNARAEFEPLVDRNHGLVEVTVLKRTPKS